MPFNNVEYWKKRMYQSLTSNWKSWTGPMLAKIKSDAAHINLETKEIDELVEKINKAHFDLQMAVANAKVKEEKA